MICEICGYREDFIDECPCHEPPVAERLETIRKRKKIVQEINEILKKRRRDEND